MFFQLVFFLSIFSFSFAEEKSDSINEYIYFLKKYPFMQIESSHQHNEIELVTDVLEIDKIQEKECARLLEKNVHPLQATEWSRAGVVASDPFLFWIRDPVIFPSGNTGLYKRIIWRCTLNGEHPVAVLPLTKSKEILLIKTWRHATGTWEFEIPRGAPNSRELTENVALRELKEETGFVATDIQLVGYVNPDSGVLATTIAVFVAQGNILSAPCIDEEEVIAGTYKFTLAQIEHFLSQGYIDLVEKDKKLKVNLRDPFLTYALYQAKLKKLL